MTEPQSTRDLGAAVEEVTRRAQLIVRDEIELAKTEVTEKVTKLIKGAVVGVVAGIFLLVALLYFLHGLSWGFYRWFFPDGGAVWLGYFITTFLLVLLGAIGGFIAYRLVKAGSPPKPQMAIDEAQLVRKTVEEARSGTPSSALSPSPSPSSSPSQKEELQS